MSGATYPQIDPTVPAGPVADMGAQRANWAATKAQLDALWAGGGLGNPPPAGFTVTAPLTVSTASKPTFAVDVPDDTAQAAVQLQIAGSPRWVMHTIPGPEVGGNSGTDFAIGRFDDQGHYLSDMVNVSRQTGEVSLYGDLQAYGNGFYFPNAVEFLVAGAQVATVNSAAAMMAQPDDPPAFTSLVYNMLGLGGTLTPQRNGRLLVTVDGQIQNDTQSQQTRVQLCVGTGAPPANGDARTGTVIGKPVVFEATSNSDPQVPFSLTVLVTSLTPGTAYWLDLAGQVTGGVGTISNLNLTAVEIL